MAKTSEKAGKYVYLFGNKKADGNGSMKPLLGGKGANLAEMTQLGLPVPPGFTITTEVCTYFYANKRKYPRGLQAQIEARVAPWRGFWGRSSATEQPAAGFRALGGARFDAGDDGHDPQPRPERRNGAGAGAGERQCAVCMGLLPPVRPDVWRRGDRREEGRHDDQSHSSGDHLKKELFPRQHDVEDTT